MTSDFPEFEKAYSQALLPDDPDQFDLLAAKANFNIYHSNLWHGTARRFAELIVQECMSIIKQNENASLNISNFTDEKKQGIQLGLEFAITDIAEHFGVEL